MKSDDLLDYIHDAVYELLSKHGGDELVAIKATQELCQQIMREFGGREHYLPALKKYQRYRQILADVDAGLDRHEVAARNKVCEKTVREAIRMRAVNPNLF